MSHSKRIIALVGAYRAGGVSDTAVEEILAAARNAGAETTKVYLADRRIAFCMNCRECTLEPGETPGKCPLQDDMQALLTEIDEHDALVLASPVNFFTVTAVTKRFIERLICHAYWPWGAAGPKLRRPGGRKRAVLVVSLAAPTFMIPPFNHIGKIMETAAGLLGAARPVCSGLECPRCTRNRNCVRASEGRPIAWEHGLRTDMREKPRPDALAAAHPFTGRRKGAARASAVCFKRARLLSFPPNEYHHSNQCRAHTNETDCFSCTVFVRVHRAVSSCGTRLP